MSTLKGAVAPGTTEDRYRDAARQRDRAVVRVLLWVLGVNLVVATTKLVLGIHLGAVALLADAVHSYLDSASNVIGLVGVGIAARPPDEEHPYGHRRFETLASVAIGVLVLAGLARIVAMAGERLLSDAPTPSPPLSAGLVVAGTVAINVVLSRYERARGQRLRSPILIADAGHTMSDALAAVVVLCSFAGTMAGLGWADGAASLVVCAFIARTAWTILTPNLHALVDRAQLDREDVSRIAASVTGVVEVDSIRSRGSMSGVYVDLTIRLAPDVPLRRAHDTAHLVSAAIHDAFPQVLDVIVHVEPTSPPRKA